MPEKNSAKIFVIHAAPDHKYFQKLQLHLALLVRQNLATVESAATVPLNQDVLTYVADCIRTSDVILFLVTSHFFELCEQQEKAALAERQRRGAIVIPVRVRRVDDELAAFSGLVSLPRDSSWLAEDHQEVAWAEMARQIRDVLREPRPAPSLSPEQPVIPVSSSFPEQSQNLDEVRLLLLTANTLREPPLMVAREFETIEERRNGSADRDQFRLWSAYALRSSDLIKHMLDRKPKLVHFSGHAAPGGIMLEDPARPGTMQVVPPAALGQMFKALNCVRCVVLSACYLADRPEQAQALAEVAGCVIAVSGEFHDSQSLNFAIGFYDALFRHESVGLAFELGAANLAMVNLPGDALKLFTRQGVDPNQYFLT